MGKKKRENAKECKCCAEQLAPKMIFRETTFSAPVNALKMEIFDKLSAPERLPVNPALLQEMFVHEGLQRVGNQQGGAGGAGKPSSMDSFLWHPREFYAVQQIGSLKFRFALTAYQMLKTMPGDLMCNCWAALFYQSLKNSSQQGTHLSN